MSAEAILFLVNEKAGRVQDEGADAVEASLREGLDGRPARFVVGNVPTLLAALKGDSRAVATVGGDGTIGAVASELQGQDDHLFIPLPFGTANLIPRDIGLPMDPAEALRAALCAPTRRIDYAAANDRALLHSAVFGTFADVAEAREALRAARGMGERLGALGDAAVRLIAAIPEDYVVEIDGERLDVQSNAVFVTNNTITKGAMGRPVRERLDAGRLDVYVSDSVQAGGFAQRVFEAVTGGLGSSEGLRHFRCHRAVVRSGSAEPIPYAVDGEVVDDEKRVAFTIAPGALSVPDLRG